MSKPVVFTSSIPVELESKLSSYALSQKKAKNKIIEEALIQYFKNLEREQFRESLREFGRSTEFNEMAEWGLGDYSDQIAKFPYESR